jgi:hypothetical protein
MDRYEGPQTDLDIKLHRGLYLAIKMDSYGGTHTALTIALIMPLLSHYNGPLLETHTALIIA